MYANLPALTKATLFFVLAFGLCLMVALMEPLFGARTPIVAMPTALGAHRAGVRGWGLAVLLPALVLGAAYGAVWLSGVGTFSPPRQSGSVLSLALDVGVAIVVTTLIFTVGEEVGWRGYLLPHLMSVGPRRALLLSGFLHGVWHLPVMIGTLHYHGLGSRFIVVPLFLCTLTAAGVCYGYLRLTTASVWPAAIAHGSFNVMWERLQASTVTTSPLALEYLAGESGVLTLAALVGAAVWLARRLPLPTRAAYDAAS
ncbi:MAG TPA: CPBP family intramembrane glutamic endopeptidase [Candidatus Binatia bacterium]|jgi:membrane protease YdiL (CAAX protease family)